MIVGVDFRSFFFDRPSAAFFSRRRWNSRLFRRKEVRILIASFCVVLIVYSLVQHIRFRRALAAYRGPRFLRLDDLHMSCKSRLGNTLFREASLRVLAARLNRTRFVDPRNCANFSEQVRDLPNVLHGVPVFDSSHLPYARVRTATENEEVCEDIRRWNVDEQMPVVALSGNFFQCYRYFHEQKAEIRRFLRFSTEVRERVERKAELLFGYDHSHKLCVHARRTDFLSPEVSFMEESRLDFAIPALDFVLRRLHAHFDEISVVIFSDDREFARQIRPDPASYESIYVVDEPNPSDAMELGSRYCDSMLLTASSSTFGWWVAYLMAEEAQRRVFYNVKTSSVRHFGKYRFDFDTFPPEWTRLHLNASGRINEEKRWLHELERDGVRI